MCLFCAHIIPINMVIIICEVDERKKCNNKYRKLTKQGCMTNKHVRCLTS